MISSLYKKARRLPKNGLFVGFVYRIYTCFHFSTIEMVLGLIPMIAWLWIADYIIPDKE